MNVREDAIAASSKVMIGAGGAVTAYGAEAVSQVSSMSIADYAAIAGLIVTCLTGIYMLGQIGLLVPKYIECQRIKRRRAKNKRRTDGD